MKIPPVVVVDTVEGQVTKEKVMEKVEQAFGETDAQTDMFMITIIDEDAEEVIKQLPEEMRERL